jgi:biotin carboxyl carrier protein
MELIAKIGKTTHEIAIEPASEEDGKAPGGGHRFRIAFDGAEHVADLLVLERGGSYSLLLDGRPFDVRQLPGGGLRVGDRPFPVEIDDARRFRVRLASKRAGGGAGETVRSPMPGKVVLVPVALGDPVRPGQTVAIVEAMKMQNELAAEGGGRVKEVRVSAGQVVDSGEALVVLEEAPA